MQVASVFHALILGFRQLGDPASETSAGALCAARDGDLHAAGRGGRGAVLGVLDPTGLGWLDAHARGAGSAAALVLAWLLFPIVIAVAWASFADEVVDAVERRLLPRSAAAVGHERRRERTLARYASPLVALALNLLALPLYLLPGANSSSISR